MAAPRKRARRVRAPMHRPETERPPTSGWASTLGGAADRDRHPLAAGARECTAEDLIDRVRHGKKWRAGGTRADRPARPRAGDWVPPRCALAAPACRRLSARG